MTTTRWRSRRVASSTSRLAPHFAIEEAQLAPLVDNTLAERLLSEHRALERAIAAIARREAGALAFFAGLLEAHVRFEERVFFPECERHLPPGFGLDASAGAR